MAVLEGSPGTIDARLLGFIDEQASSGKAGHWKVGYTLVRSVGRRLEVVGSLEE